MFTKSSFYAIIYKGRFFIMKHVDINNIDFSDNPVFSHPEDHYFDRQDAYIDLEDSYLIANIRAENARKSSVSSVSSAAGGSFWNSAAEDDRGRLRSAL